MALEQQELVEVPLQVGPVQELVVLHQHSWFGLQLWQQQLGNPDSPGPLESRLLVPAVVERQPMALWLRSLQRQGQEMQLVAGHQVLPLVVVQPRGQQAPLPVEALQPLLWQVVGQPVAVLLLEELVHQDEAAGHSRWLRLELDSA